MKKSAALLLGVSVTALAYAANAETANPSIDSFLATMNAGGGSEALQWQVAPTYSELFGLGVRGTVGGYVNEDFALGAEVFGGKRKALGMVAGATRDNAGFFGVAKLGEFVHGATDFECAGALQVFGFEHHLATEALAEICRGNDRCVQHYAFAALAGC